MSIQVITETENERLILEALIERLAPQVAGFSPNGYWIGDRDGEAAQWECLRSGIPLLAQALRIAQSALASNDPEMIAAAARIAPGSERDGIKLAALYRETLRRRAGGRRNGDAQTAEAVRKWAPHVAKFHQLMEAGKSRPLARSITAKDLSFKASDRTLRKWLR